MPACARSAELSAIIGARPQPFYEVEGLRCTHRARLLDHLPKAGEQFVVGHRHQLPVCFRRHGAFRRHVTYLSGVSRVPRSSHFAGGAPLFGGSGH